MGRFFYGHPLGCGCAGQGGREKSVTEIIIGDIIILPVDFGLKKKTCGIAIAGQTQTKLKSTNNYQRD